MGSISLLNHGVLRRSLAVVGLALGMAALATRSAFAADLVITNAHVFTATDAGILESASVVITGERIEAVSTGPVDTGGAEIIDAAGQMVLPGLIDTHLHTFFDLASLDGSVTQGRFPRNDSEASFYIQERVPERLEAYLEQGFTSVLSPTDFWPQILETRKLMDSGNRKGARLFVAGGTFTGPGTHFMCAFQEGAERQWCDDHIAVALDDANTAREWVGRYAESGVDVIAFDSLSPNLPWLVTETPELEPEPIKAMIEEAHAHGLRVFLTNYSAGHVNDFVTWGIDGFLAPPRVVRDEDGSLLARAAGLPFGVTIGATEERYRLGVASRGQVMVHKIGRENIFMMLKHGAVPVFSADLGDKIGTTPADVLRIAAEAMAGVGLSREEILLAATRDAAELILGRDDLGAIEPGRLADIIMVDGDPLIGIEDLLNVTLVIKGGELVVDNR